MRASGSTSTLPGLASWRIDLSAYAMCDDFVATLPSEH
jgi:hypothetical protein